MQLNRIFNSVAFAGILASSVLVGMSADAAIYTHSFSGIAFDNSSYGGPTNPIFPGGDPTSFAGSFTYDSSWADSHYSITDSGAYLYTPRLAPFGISLTTNTGLTVTSGNNFEVGVQVAGGGNYFQDRVTIFSSNPVLPTGWTSPLSLMYVQLDGYSSPRLHEDDSHPRSLQLGDGSVDDFIEVYSATVRFDLYNYSAPGVGSGSLASFNGLIHYLTLASIENTAQVNNQQQVTLGAPSELGSVLLDFGTNVNDISLNVTYSVKTIGGDQGPFSPGTFTLSPIGENFPVWDIDVEGELSQPVTFTLALDENTQFVEGLGVWHFDGNVWEFLGGSYDEVSHSITATTDSFSPVTLGYAPTSGVVPEPMSVLVWAGLIVGTVTVARPARTINNSAPCSA